MRLSFILKSCVAAFLSGGLMAGIVAAQSVGGGITVPSAVTTNPSFTGTVTSTTGFMTQGTGGQTGYRFGGDGTSELYSNGDGYYLRIGSSYMQFFGDGGNRVPAIQFGLSGPFLTYQSDTRLVLNAAANGGGTPLGLGVGSLDYPPITAPANPASGWRCYTDTADATLKCRNSARTVRSIAAP